MAGSLKSQLQIYIQELLKSGEAWIYEDYDNEQIFILESSCVSPSFGDKDLLSALNYGELMESITYSGKGSPQISKENIHPIFDIGINQRTFRGVSRSTLGQSMIDLAESSRKALSAAMKRNNLVFMAPDLGGNASSVGMSLNPIIKKTREEKQEDNQKFQEDYALENGVVRFLDRPYKAIEVNPDNGKLKAIEATNMSKEDLANLFDYPWKLYHSDTKFDDLELHINKYILVLSNHVDKYAFAVTRILEKEFSILKKKGYKVGFKFDKFKETIYKNEEDTTTEG